MSTNPTRPNSSTTSTDSTNSTKKSAKNNPQQATETNKTTVSNSETASAATSEVKDSKERASAGKAQKPTTGPPPSVQPKPQLTRAERRAIQEAQRAAKEQKKTTAPSTAKGREAQQTTGGAPKKQNSDQVSGTPTPPVSTGGGHRAHSETTDSTTSLAPRTNRTNTIVNATNVSTQNSSQVQKSTTKKKPNEDVTLFSHLTIYTRQSQGFQMASESKLIHPAFVKLGLQYAEKQIVGSNLRCIAFLVAMKQMIDDYQGEADATGSSLFDPLDLNAKIKANVNFLTKCRPIAVTMGTAIRILKAHIERIPRETTNTEAKEYLNEVIRSFIRDKIELPGKAIAETYAISKITDGDVILIFGYSSLITRILETATKRGIKFRVIIVDSRPQNLGLKSAHKLLSMNVKCTYILINTVPSIISEVTKVLLGAHGLLGNGYVMSQIGTAQISLIAKTHNVPVLVCCETYKFSERVQTDSFVFNELGDPNDLAENSRELNPNGSTKNDWSIQNPTLNILNMTYDVTPPNFISAVITELGILPCTSVAVVIRMQNKQLDELDAQDQLSRSKTTINQLATPPESIQ